MESHVFQQLNSVFGDSTLYEILEVPQNATEAEIKKAYKKLALKYHPDKGGDPEKFKAISVVHSILSDPDKRRLYDSNGELDDNEFNEEMAHWYEYFRALFPKVTTAAIDEFSKTYKGSDEERNDILRIFVEQNGDIEAIMECVMLAEEDDEGRISSIIDEAIASGELSMTLPYENYKKRYQKKVSKQSRSKSITKTTSKKKTKISDENIENGASLESMILNRQRKSSDILGNLMKKYCDGAVEELDIPDEAFEQARLRVQKNKERSNSSTIKATKIRSKRS